MALRFFGWSVGGGVELKHDFYRQYATNSGGNIICMPDGCCTSHLSSTVINRGESVQSMSYKSNLLKAKNLFKLN
jgi:hypothetical protein